MIQRSHHDQRDDGNQPVLPGTVLLASRPACHIIDSRRIQGKSDRKYYCTSDQRREKSPDLLDEDPHDNSYDTAHDLSAQDRRHIKVSRDRLHCGYIGEADAHDDWKARPKGDGAVLDQRK